MNTIGKLFKLTTFGESHGPGIGGVIDGCPAGLCIDFEQVAREMNRRRPGQSAYTTPRTEEDNIKWLSGVVDGKTTGAPIAFVIENKDVRSEDYQSMSDAFRPGHADYTYFLKYGLRPQPGGGRSSARETASRVVAGAIAKQLLGNTIEIIAYTENIGGIAMNKNVTVSPNLIERSAVRCPDEEASQKMMNLLTKTMQEGDSLGGIVTCVLKGVPAGWGEPLYDKLPARLAEAMMSINAAKGFEIGDGFNLSAMKGSQANGCMVPGAADEYVVVKGDSYGGTLGGISTGQEIHFRVVFKPTPTIGVEQQTVDVHGQSKVIAGKGRHDPCVVPRAVPVVEAMAAIVLADLMLMNKCNAHF